MRWRSDNIFAVCPKLVRNSSAISNALEYIWEFKLLFDKEIFKSSKNTNSLFWRP